MTKLQLLHQALNERLKTTVVQIMALVSETVLEYEAETVRVRMENEALRRKLVAFECPETPAELPAVSPSLTEQFSFECLAEELGIKQEPVFDLLCSESTMNLTTTPNNPASDAEMDRDVTVTMTQSYTAPVEQTKPQQNLSRKQKFSFTCLVCSKVFARKITLDIHKRVHTKTRPYDLRNHKTDQKKKWKRHRFSQMQRAELSNTTPDEPDQNSNGASTDPEATTPLSKEEPEEFTAETEQITSHTCPEDQKSGHLTQNLCENATDSIKVEDDFIKCKHKVVYELVTDKCWICHLPTTSVKWRGVRCQQCCGVWHNICLQRSSEDWDAESEDDGSSDESFSDSESSGSELELPEPSKKSRDTNKQEKTDDIQDGKNILMDLEISDDLQSDPESEPESSEHQKTKDASEETDTVDILDQSKSPTKSSKVLKCHVNYCFVCGKPQTKLARHLERHVNEDAEIAQALQLPKSSKNRKVLLENFRNLGNFRHNSVVKATGSGCLKVKRSSKQSSSFETYYYCLYCKCMLSRKELSRHTERCAWRPENNVEEGVIAQSAQSTTPQPISSGLCSVLGKMHKDEVSIAVRSDHYLMQFAQSLFNKHGSDRSKHEYIRQKVRELGRLLVTLRHTTSIFNMEDAVNPGNFFSLTSAVKEVSGLDHENGTFISPSLALNIGHSLRKISDIIMCRALMEKDQEVIASIRRFHTLYKTKWSEFVSHSAVSNPSEALETGSVKDIQGEALDEIGEGIDDMDIGSQQLPNVSTFPQGTEEMLTSVTFASADVSETAAQDDQGNAACVTSGSPHLPDSVTQGVPVSRMGCVKRRWTEEETRAVMKHMRPFIQNGITVSIEQCRKCKEKEQHILSTRSVQNIRDFVRNRGVALKRYYSNNIQFAGPF